jgi:group I intron endonuclease
MKTKICGVYKITSPSGSFYIGSSVDVKSRWAGHRGELRRGKHHCPPLQRAATKYGVDTFTFEVLEECPRDVLREREQVYLNDLKPEYNASQSTFEVLTEKWQDPAFRANGIARASEQIKRFWQNPEFVENQRAASSASLARQHTDPAFKAAHAARIAEQARRINADPEIKARQIAARNARYAADPKLAEARSERARAAMIALHENPEAVEKMRKVNRERMKAMRADPEARARNAAGIRARFSKPVLCVDTGIKYPSATDAANALGMRPDSVARAAKGRDGSHRTGGMTFQYVQSNEP